MISSIIWISANIPKAKPHHTWQQSYVCFNCGLDGGFRGVKLSLFNESLTVSKANANHATAHCSCSVQWSS